MAGLGWAAKCLQLIVRNCLKTMLSQEPQTLELHATDTFSLCMVIPLHSLHGIDVHRMVRKQNAVEILHHVVNSQGLYDQLNHSLENVGVCGIGFELCREGENSLRTAPKSASLRMCGLAMAHINLMYRLTQGTGFVQLIVDHGLEQVICLCVRIE